MNTLTPPTPVTFQCSACGTQHTTAGGLPLHWSTWPKRGLVWCPDCSDSASVAETVKATPARRKAKNTHFRKDRA